MDTDGFLSVTNCWYTDYVAQSIFKFVATRCKRTRLISCWYIPSSVDVTSSISQMQQKK